MEKGLLALTLLASVSYGQSWEVGQTFAYLPQAGTIIDSGSGRVQLLNPRPTLRITASHQPLAALRAVTRERIPEGTALYSVAVCNLGAASVVVDPRQVEQSLEMEGVAVMVRPLAQAVVNRSRFRALGSALLRGEAASAAGMALSSAKLTGAVSGLHPAIPIGLMALGWVADGLSRSAERKRSEATADISAYGAWLTDSVGFSLEPHGCGQRWLVLGSYQRGQTRTLVIEVE